METARPAGTPRRCRGSGAKQSPRGARRTSSSQGDLCGGSGMGEHWLHVDLAGIQDYVFRSRELLDAIGRAVQVEELTDEAKLRASRILRDGDSVVARGAGTLTLASRDRGGLRALAGRYSRRVADTS